jgi:hypothetical protein
MGKTYLLISCKLASFRLAYVTLSILSSYLSFQVICYDNNEISLQLYLWSRDDV